MNTDIQIEKINCDLRSITTSYGEALFGFSSRESIVTALDKINEIIDCINSNHPSITPLSTKSLPSDYIKLNNEQKGSGI